jgi:hypothetical protein
MADRKLIFIGRWNLNRLDKGITLPRRRGPKAARRKSVRGGLCLRLIPLTLAAAVSMIFIPPSKADMNLKLFAYNQMSWDEFQCFNWLIIKESNWNPKARNGSHYGLGQMRSTWYRDLSPQQQVLASIKYITHRYGDSCKALSHFERKGWH